MKSGAFIVALAVAIAVPAAAEHHTFPIPPMFGEPPSKTIVNWTRLSILGEVHAPLPVEWMSPQRFSRPGFERLIVLSPKKYAEVVGVIPAIGCASSVVGIKERPHWRALEITQSRAAVVRECILAGETACRFLSAAAEILGARRRRDRAEFIRILDSQLACHLMGAERTEHKF